VLQPAAITDKGEEVPWRSIHGELNANRYSPLDQIDADNARDLEVIWRWKAGNYGPTPEIRNVSMPIMRYGRLYFGAGSTRNIVSVDAETGQTLWMWRPDEGERFENAPRKSSGHGVAYWEDNDGRRRVITVTPGYNLVSLNADTGLPDPDFGAGGWVDLTIGLRTAKDRDLDIGLNAPPLVVGDVIVVGAAHDIGGRPPLMRNVKGDVRGFDARTGELLWTFHTIPEPDEPGYETWYDGSADYTGNAGVWAPMSADPELGLVYLPVEAPTGDYYGGPAPTGDYYGGPRHGANLYANCLVALDVITGEIRWYFQLIHHDIWDWDIPTAPILADLPNGRKLLGLGHPDRTDSRRLAEWQKACGANYKTEFRLCLRSRNRRTGLADRGTAGTTNRCAGRVDVADTALPDEAGAVRPPGIEPRRSDCLYAGD
jgi:quinoprotein glucose dehydrogenase